MADGENIGEEVVVRAILDDSDLKRFPQSVQQATAGAQQYVTDFNKETLKIYKEMPGGLQKMIESWRIVKPPIAEAVASLREFGLTNKQIVPILQDMEYKGAEAKQMFKELGVTAKETRWNFAAMAQSLEWAAYRFLFSLAVYMAFRKIIRSVNETIQESIRLFKEFAEAQQTLSANVQVNEQIVGKAVGSLAEWNSWIVDTAAAWKTTKQAVTDATNAALQANATLRRTGGELQDIIKLGRAVAIMWGQYKDGQVDVAWGVETVTDAIRGQESALIKLGVREEDVAATVGMTVDDFHKQSDQFQENARWAYIVNQRYEEIGKGAKDATSGVDALSSTLDALIKEQKTGMGEFATIITNLPKIIEVGVLAITGTIGDLIDKLIDLQNAATEAKGPLIALGLAAGGPVAVGFMILLGAIGKVRDGIADLLGWAKEAVSVETKMETATRKNAEAFSKTITPIKEATLALKGITQQWRELGRTVVDYMRGYYDDLAAAGRDYAKDYAKTFEDQAKDELDLNERYDKKAEDLKKHALDRIADLRKQAAEQEAQEREDLDLRLKQMEEDHLLDMKHLYENYSLDMEEAARNRDVVTMRRLQRQYKLEKKQREEDYQLDRKHTIENWDQRHKDDKKNLEDEVKDIQDNLAQELAELEQERADELQALQDNWDERRQELTDQYNQELADLKDALYRRLTDAITEWADQNNIPLDSMKAVVAGLAEQYDLDATNLTNMVTAELDLLETLRAAWDAVHKAASGMETSMIKTPTAAKGGIAKFAQGGMAIATAPTLVKVGEAGPELFSAIPLAKGGALIGGLGRGYIDAHLTIDGNQTGLWSTDFERGVEHTVARIFKEAFQE
jgi:Skp family chaperone for outer membrane proteins